ncbi:MAG: cation-translocating P-type ATPase [Clostridia bacterium]|nr:cation-translocating P-type ATPase [Clostridia bacterium]
MSDQRIVVYKIKDAENALKDRAGFLDLVKEIGGVTAVEFNDDENDLVLKLDDWASEYDVMTAVMEIAKKYGADLSFDEDEKEADSDGETAAIVDEEKEEPTDDMKKDEEDDEKGGFIEKALTLGLSAICIIVACFLGNFPDVQTWIYTFAFAFAGYEILLSAISKIATKKNIIEECLILSSSLILLYIGKKFSGSMIAFGYSLLNFLYSRVEYVIKHRIEKLSKNQENIVDFEKFYDRYNTIGDSVSALYSKKAFIVRIVFIAVAALLAFIPPFFNIAKYGQELLNKWLYVGAGVLGLSQVSVLIKIIGDVKRYSILRLAERGALLNSGVGLDSFSEVDKVVFDKTGVVTFPKAEIYEILSENKERCLKLLKIAEKGIVHPIADGICDDESSVEAENVVYERDLGIACLIDGAKVLVGNKKLMTENSVAINEYEGDASPVYVAENGKQIGVVAFKYSVRNNFVGAVLELKNDLGVKSEIISADSLSYVGQLKEETGVAKAVAGASDSYKVKYLAQAKGLYVGHGEYDSEVLSRAPLSVALGKEDPDCAVSVSGDVKEIPNLIKTAKRAKRISKQNFVLPIGYKLVLFLAFIFTYIFTEMDCVRIYVVSDVIITCLLELNSLRNLSDPA